MKLAFIVLLLGLASCAYKMCTMWQEIKDMDCLAALFDVFLFRGYKEACKVDKNAKPNFEKCNTAKSGACAFYITPVSKCEATSVVTDFCKEVVEGSGKRFAIIVDVADPPHWSSETATNRAYMEALIAALNARTSDCVYWVAILTSKWEWEKIFGADYTGMSGLRLMWEFIDRNPEFDPETFVNFGGWTKPFAKMFDRNLDACENGVDAVTWGIAREEDTLDMVAPIDE